jgi:Glycosyl transferase family 2
VLNQIEGERRAPLRGARETGCGVRSPYLRVHKPLSAERPRALIDLPQKGDHFARSAVGLPDLRVLHQRGLVASPVGGRRSDEITRVQLPDQAAEALSVLVLIPAHDDADVLRECLAAVYRQTVPFDQIVVVDTCTDDTVKVAQSFGAVVVEPNVQG